jgi:ABC-type nitrate/sulfonate/bicarbonate transport system substrate-binding protein
VIAFNMKRNSHLRLIISIASLIFGFASARAAALEKLTSIIGGTGTRHAIPVLASSFGLYAKYGLDAAIVRAGGGLATSALLSGDVDVANTAGAALVNARLHGSAVLYITNFNDWSDAHLLVRPEIKSIEQLYGGKFAVPSLGGGYVHVLRSFLFPKYGLDKGAKPPTIISAGDTPAALPGVISGQYDAALGSYEQYMAFRKRGLKALITPEDLNIKWYTGLITTDKKLKERRRLLVQFIRAQIETISIIKREPAKARAALKAYFRSNDDELMAEYQKYLSVKLPLMTRVEPDHIKTLLLTSNHPAAKSAKPEEFIDNSLVEEIVREGFIKQFER